MYIAILYAYIFNNVVLLLLNAFHPALCLFKRYIKVATCSLLLSAVIDFMGCLPCLPCTQGLPPPRNHRYSSTEHLPIAPLYHIFLDKKTEAWRVE